MTPEDPTNMPTSEVETIRNVEKVWDLKHRGNNEGNLLGTKKISTCWISNIFVFSLRFFWGSLFFTSIFFRWVGEPTTNLVSLKSCGASSFYRIHGTERWMPSSDGGKKTWYSKQPGFFTRCFSWMIPMFYINILLFSPNIN